MNTPCIQGLLVRKIICYPFTCIVQIAILIHDLIPRKSTRKLTTIKYTSLYYPSDQSLLCEVLIRCIKECKINNH